VADTKETDLFERLVTFMRESDEWGTPADVLRSAEEAGLHIVSEADKRVLESCAAFPAEALTGDLYPSRGNRDEWSGLSLRWSEAELEARKTRALRIDFKVRT